MKQIAAGPALILFALSSLWLQTPALGRQSNVRGLRRGFKNAVGYKEVHDHRVLKKRKKKNNEQKAYSYDEAFVATEFNSRDSLMMPQEDSGDPDFIPGDAGSLDVPDALTPTASPPGTGAPTVMPDIVALNVSIAYLLDNSATVVETSGDAVQASEVQVTKASSLEGNRHRLQEGVELTPTEAEIDALIKNTFDFYFQVYQDAFEGILVSITPIAVITQDVSPGVFFLSYKSHLAFSTAPPPEDVADVASDIETQVYIEFYVWPSGPYFSETKSVEIVAEASNEVSFEHPTEIETAPSTTDSARTPTALPSATLQIARPTVSLTIIETASPTLSPTDAIETAIPSRAATEGFPVSDGQTEGEVLLTTQPTAGAVSKTMEPTPSDPMDSETPVTAAPTAEAPAEPNVVLATLVPTDVDQAQPTPDEGTGGTITIAPSEGNALETSPPTPSTQIEESAPPVEITPETLSPTTSSGTQAPTPCAGRSVRVIGTILLELDPEANLTEPTDDQVVEVAQHILQDFGVILRDTYGNAIRGFTATIDETNTALDGSSYPLGFDADILFSPCAPPTEEVNAIFENADFPAILEGFEATGDDNVFNELTGEATYTGEAAIAF